MTENPLNCSADWLDWGSPLTEKVAGYVPRAPQQRLATAIENCISERGQLIAEAGTGTGKTFAYLVPVILSGLKAIISTGTKNLQDQLFFRDLPRVQEGINRPLKVALLKGRANYLCHYHLERNYQEGRFHSRELVKDLRYIRSSLSRTVTGDLSEFSQLSEQAEVWSYATSTKENCLGSDCEYFQRCFLVKARRKALEADLVIVNHALFFSDLQLKESDTAELLPHTEVIVLDEAHQLPDIARQYFGEQCSSRAFIYLLKEIQAFQKVEAKDMPELGEASHALERGIQDLRLMMGETSQRQVWSLLAKQGLIQAKLLELEEGMVSLEAYLALAKVRDKEWGLFNQRFIEISQSFKTIIQMIEGPWVHWYETFPQSFIIHKTPEAIGPAFLPHLSAQNRAWIFTSATLSANHNFEHFQTVMGLEQAQTLHLDSPFDYPKQALLYVPRYLPEPKMTGFIPAFVEAIVPVLEASQGRAFILFTSYQALHTVAEILPTRLSFPLFIQGTATKDALLQQFALAESPILLGTSSFWEGVDVRGQQLSVVIIDKLPFAVPGDPIFEARLNLLRKEKKDPFLAQQLPEAAIMLKQGAGRLIRDVEDKGVLMITDPRLVNRDFGAYFLASLPPLKRTRELKDVVQFLQALR